MQLPINDMQRSSSKNGHSIHGIIDGGPQHANITKSRWKKMFSTDKKFKRKTEAGFEGTQQKNHK